MHIRRLISNRFMENKNKFMEKNIIMKNPLAKHYKVLEQSKPKVKTTDRTKIELDLKDAHRLANVLKPDPFLDTEDYQLVNLLIKKLRNAEPELEF